MGKVVLGTNMSLDGFINDRNGDVGPLYADFAALADMDEMQETMAATGAVVMGRHTYEMANGDFTGYEFQTPIFVVTHDRPAQPAKGENDKLKFHFVTDGVASALRQAKTAAGDKDVTIVGGASIAQQSLPTGLVDELEIGIVPVLLGGGLRYLDQLGPDAVKLEIARVREVGGTTIINYRVLNEVSSTAKGGNP